MPRTKEQFEEIRKEKTNLIMKVAMELFASEGFMQTPISKIAKAANISKGLMYNYFESKEELLKAIVNQGVSETFESFDRDGDGHLSSDEFEYFVRQSFIQTKKNKEFYKLLYIIMLQPNIHSIITEASADISTKVLSVASEYFQQYFNDPQTEFILFSSVMKGLNMQYIFGNGYITDEMLEQAVQKIIDHYKR